LEKGRHPLLCLEQPQEITFNCSFTPIGTSDVNTDIAFQILLNEFEEDLAAIKTNNTKVIKLKKIKKLLDSLNQAFSLTLCNRSLIVRELFILHHLSKAFDRLNEEKLNLSYIQFRHSIYFPNIIYILIRLLPNAKKFLHVLIRKVYQEFSNKACGLVNIHVNSFYMDQDTIKSDVLKDFLGNGVKKFNPLEIGNIKAFYKSCFRSIFQFYFKRKRNLEDQDLVSFSFFDANIHNGSSSNRLSIYRDVLYEIQVEKTQRKHSILGQLSYNFQIFRNIIVTNEFQNIYQNSKRVDNNISNNEYKLIDFFDDDIFSQNPELFEQIRELPMIYKLLRCIHIQAANTLPYNDFVIKPESVKFVIVEELSASFKNMFIDSYVSEILEQIARNFIKSVLSGEYINLITFSTVKINHLSFLDQLRKFIRLCLKS